jgi:hypothetical protein
MGKLVKRHYSTGLYNGHGPYSLWGKKWTSIYSQYKFPHKLPTTWLFIKNSWQVLQNVRAWRLSFRDTRGVQYSSPVYQRLWNTQKISTVTSPCPIILFSPCIVNDYNLLVSTNIYTRITLIHIFHLIWLLHVSARRHAQRVTTKYLQTHSNKIVFTILFTLMYRLC